MQKIAFHATAITAGVALAWALSQASAPPRKLKRATRPSCSPTPITLRSTAPIQAGHSRHRTIGTATHIGEGRWLTAQHAITAKHPQIIHEGRPYPIQILDTDPDADLALCTCDAPIEWALPIAPTPPATGQTIQTARGPAKILTQNATSIQITGLACPGDSGGPIWSKGGLCGIISAISRHPTPNTTGPSWDAIQRICQPTQTPKPAPLVPIEPKTPEPPTLAEIIDALPPIILQIIDDRGKIQHEHRQKLGEPIRIRLKTKNR